MKATWEQAGGTLVADLQGIFGARLQSVVAYGPHLDGDTSAPLTCLALVSSLAIADLEACAHRRARWDRGGIATPLLLSGSELRRSLDAFPLEYGEIIRNHVRLYGEDPFTGVTIAHDDLRRIFAGRLRSVVAY